MPQPRIRAALASLVGTAADPLIDLVRDGTLTKHVRIGGYPHGPNDLIPFVGGAIATSTTLYFHESANTASFVALAPVVAHELLHSDPVGGIPEEVMANGIDSLVSMQMLLRNPDIAALNDAYSVTQRTKLMLRINSGDGTSLGLTHSGFDLAPGGWHWTDFSDWVRRSYPARFSSLATPGSKALTEVLNALGVSTASTTIPNFDAASIAELDRASATFSSQDVVRVASLIGLDSR
jgi:hypothetical protein